MLKTKSHGLSKYFDGIEISAALKGLSSTMEINIISHKTKTTKTRMGRSSNRLCRIEAIIILGIEFKVMLRKTKCQNKRNGDRAETSLSL